jgi:hypothetical protein
MKFTLKIHTTFAIMWIFSHRISVIFDTLLPTMNKTLHTSVVKFLASASEDWQRTLCGTVHVCHHTVTPTTLDITVTKITPNITIKTMTLGHTLTTMKLRYQLQ